MFTVFCDAGHGKNTAGKRSCDGKIREWVINDKVVDAFISQMGKYKDVKVVRTDDPTGVKDIPLKERTSKANAANADFYISFHHNASGNGKDWNSATGTEVYCYKTGTKSHEIAKKLAPVVAKAYGLKDRGAKTGNLHIVRETKMPAVLIEGGFMTNKSDCAKFTDATLKKVGVEVAKAIASYFGLKLKPTPKPTTTTTTTKPSSNSSTYTIQKGDTLYSIAKKFKCTVANLKAWNNIKDASFIKVGQKIVVSNVVKHKVVRGDTLWALARKYGTSVSKIKTWNNLKSDTLTIGQVLIVKK